MAKKKRKKEQIMGRFLIALGLCVKILQIIGSALSISALGGTTWTLITTCLLVGGLAVLAIERMSVVSAFSLLTVVGVIGGILPTNDYKYNFIFMAISFFAYALMLMAMKRKGRVASGVGVLILTVVIALQHFSVITLPLPAITAVLALIYVLMGVGLFM